MSTHPLPSAEISPAIQDYIKACYRLERDTNAPVPIGKLAQALNVAPPSVTNMVKRLTSLRLVRRDNEGRIGLTPQGMSVALEVVRHHRLLETFLINELGMDWAEAHEEAEVLEHYISERLESLLDQRLARPTTDPHGEPIPRKDGTIPLQRGRSLLEFEPGSTVTIRQVTAHDPQLLHYLQEQGLIPGTRIRVQRLEPFNGPLVLDLRGDTRVVSREVAACITGAAYGK